MDTVRFDFWYIWQTIFRAKDQDPELKQIMAETKAQRYSKAAHFRWNHGRGGIRGKKGERVGKNLDS